MSRPVIFVLSLALCASAAHAQSLRDVQTPVVARQVPVTASEQARFRQQALRAGVAAPAASAALSVASGLHAWKLLATFPFAVIHDLSFRNANVGYAAAEQGYIWKTADGGRHWTVSLYSDSGDYWYGVQALSDDDIVASGFVDKYDPGTNTTILQAILRWSHDGGTTWSAPVILADKEWAHRVRFGDAQHGVVVAASLHNLDLPVFSTSNGGLTLTDWTRAAPAQDAWFGDQFTVFPDGHVYASGIDYCSSADWGANWSCNTSIDPVFDGETFFADALHGWVGSGTISPSVQGWIHRTTDGGATWSARTLNAAWPIRDLHFVDAQTGWAAGGNFGSNVGGIYYSSDGGATWSLDVDTGSEMDACAPADYMLICAGYNGSYAGAVYGLDLVHIFVDGFE